MKFDVVQLESTGIDVIDGDRGKNYPHQNELLDTGFCLFLSAKNVTKSGFNFFETKFISQKKDTLLKNGKLKRGDIVITTRGTVGNVALYSPQIFYDNVRINSGMLIIRCTNNISNQYLYQVLRSEWFQKQIMAVQSGSAQPQLPKSHFLKMYIPLPSLPIQEKIASILQLIDDKVMTNNAINNNLEQQTQAIFKSWFVDFELNYGIMPSDWKVSQLGSIAKISTEVFSPAKNPNVEVEHYSIPAYDEKRYPVFETSNGIKSNKYRLSSNSVMISKLNPDTKRIWRPYCISDNPICSTEFIVYEPINPLNRDFIYSIIDSIGFSAFLCSHTTGSTNSRQRATPSITLTYDIIVPDEKTIQAFCSIVSPMYDTIENNIKENQKLAETRDKLLPKLMSGELDVSGIDL